MIELCRLVSLRHLLHAPVRSLLVLFGIALGVATVVATQATNRSILGAFHEMVERVSGKADLVVTNGEVGVSGDLVDQIREDEAVEHAASSTEMTSQSAAGGGPILVLGIDFLGDKYFLPFEVAEGEDVLEDPVRVVNDPSAILISRTLADESGLKVDDALELLTPDGVRKFHVRGILEKEGLAASFGGRVALMFSEAADAAFGRNGHVDRIDIALKKGADADSARARLQSLVGRGKGRVEHPEGRTQHIEAVYGPIRRALDIAGAIALLVGMFLIYNAVGVAVIERQREIGVLRAIGVTRARVVALFCLEASILAAVGGFIGIFLGYGLAILALAQTVPTVSRFYAAIEPAPPEVTPQLAVVAIAIGFLTTLFAAYFPARSAARVDPIEALHGRTRRMQRRSIPYFKVLAIGTLFVIPGIIGAQFATTLTSFGSMACLLSAHLCAVPALVIGVRRLLLRPVERGFGIPGRLAMDNAERSLGRSTLTIGALMTATSCSVCVGAWGVSLQASMYQWLDQSLPADLYVTSGSFLADQHNVPFRPEVVDRLKDIEGVQALYPVRIVAIDVGEKRVQLVVVDQRVYHEELERKGIGGRPPIEGPAVIDAEALVREPSVVLGENAARKLGVHAGEVLELETTTGLHPFKVSAVVIDYTSDQGTCLIDRRWFLEYWKDDLVDTVDIFLAKNADLKAVRARIRERLGGADTLFIVSAAELRDEIRSVIAQSLSIFASTDFLALAVALLGVIGTMFAAVIDRIRETGVLRAVGATARQVVLLVMLEAGFLGLLAAIGGIVAGISMGIVFVRVVGLVSTGWHVDYIFPTQGALRVGIAVLSTAALAGLLPGRRAAKLDVPEALAYE
jgi:putative ABC transport system permease protein